MEPARRGAPDINSVYNKSIHDVVKKNPELFQTAENARGTFTETVVQNAQNELRNMCREAIAEKMPKLPKEWTSENCVEKMLKQVIDANRTSNTGTTAQNEYNVIIGKREAKTKAEEREPAKPAARPAPAASKAAPPPVSPKDIEDRCKTMIRAIDQKAREPGIKLGHTHALEIIESEIHLIKEQDNKMPLKDKSAALDFYEHQIAYGENLHPNILGALFLTAKEAEQIVKEDHNGTAWLVRKGTTDGTYSITFKNSKEEKIKHIHYDPNDKDFFNKIENKYNLNDVNRIKTIVTPELWGI